MTSDSLQRELEELVLEQIYALKKTSAMNERDILEFHLRHYQIVMLYRRLDRNAKVGGSRTVGFPEDVNRGGRSVSGRDDCILLNSPRTKRHPSNAMAGILCVAETPDTQADARNAGHPLARVRPAFTAILQA